MLGAVALVAGTLAGGQIAVGAVLERGALADAVPRTSLSPYSDGAFTVRAAAVDSRVDIAGAADGSYVLGHTPAGSDVVLDLDLLSGDTASPWWVQPATGTTLQLAQLSSSGIARFPVPQGTGGSTDWVLVVDDVAAGYGAPDADAIARAVGERVRAAVAEAGSGADPDRAGSESGSDSGSGDGPDGGGSDGPDLSGSRSGGSGSDDSASRGSGSNGSGSGDSGSDGGVGDPGGSGQRSGGSAGDGPASGSEPEDRDFSGSSGSGDSGRSRDDGGSSEGGSGTDGSGSGRDDSSGDKSGGDKSGGDKTGGDDKSGDDKSGGDGSGGDGSGGNEAGGAKDSGAKDSGAEGRGGDSGTPAPRAPAPEREEKKEPTPSSSAKAADGTWDRLAQCESSGDWAISTGNGYHGVIRTDPQRDDVYHCLSGLGGVFAGIWTSISTTLLSKLVS